jgi:hypothetical protein
MILKYIIYIYLPSIYICIYICVCVCVCHQPVLDGPQVTELLTLPLSPVARPELFRGYGVGRARRRSNLKHQNMGF